MISGDFTPQGAIATSLKDVRIMLSEAAERQQSLPLGTVYADVMEANVLAGEGELDNCAVIEEVRRRKI